jgi:hypothetical protein
MPVEVTEAGNVLINPVVKNLTALATRAWAKCWMITFTAPTGIGKTTAVDYAARTLPFDHRVIACKQITTRYTILRALGLEVDNSRAQLDARF